jgi:hypothetical protein
MVADRQLLEDFLEADDKFCPASILLNNILEIHRVLYIKRHVHPVQVSNVFNNYAVCWTPMVRFALQVPKNAVPQCNF